MILEMGSFELAFRDDGRPGGDGALRIFYCVWLVPLAYMISGTRV